MYEYIFCTDPRRVTPAALIDAIRVFIYSLDGAALKRDG